MTRSGGVGVAQPTQIGITWADSNLLAGYHYMDAAGKLGAPVDRYLYDAAGLRIVEWPVGRDGVPRITLRSPSGQPLAEFAAQPGSARPALVKNVVHGPFGVVVEREVTATAPTVLNGAPMTDGAGGYNVDVSTGSGSYELDIDSISGWHNRRSGLVANANGRLIVAESDLSPGETNVLRIRKESPSTDFSAPMSVTYDPSVTASSANQVRSVSVSRSTGTITVRWAVLSDNGKNFRARYRLSDGSGSVLLTPIALPSSARSLTLTSQALATGCGTIYIGQVSPGLENETVDGPEAGVPSGLPGGMDRGDCPPGGGVSDPPQPPSPSYAFREWFQVRDHLGSVRVISDETGEARERLDYYPYGTEMSFGSLATASDRKYTGHERDDALGADYMKTRSKFTWSGSFLSPDPIDDVSLDVPSSWNKYAYVRGKPIEFSDPSGQMCSGTLYWDCWYNAAAEKPTVYCNLSGWEATCDAPNDPYAHRYRFRPVREGRAYRACKAVIGFLFNVAAPPAFKQAGAKSYVLGVGASGSFPKLAGFDAGVSGGVDRDGNAFVTANAHLTAGVGSPQASVGISGGWSSGTDAQQRGASRDVVAGMNGVLFGVAGGGDVTWSVPEGQGFLEGYWTASGTIGMGAPPFALGAGAGGGVSGGSSSVDLCSPFLE